MNDLDYLDVLWRRQQKTATWWRRLFWALRDLWQRVGGGA